MDLVWGGWNLRENKAWDLWNGKGLSAGLSFRGQGRHDRYEIELQKPLHWSEGELFDWAAQRVACYELFPPHRMKAWVDSPDGLVAPNVTVHQGVHVGPFRLRMADRVLAVSKGENEGGRWFGFTYGTLEGHAEQGIEEFQVRWMKESSKVRFTMEAWSRAGHWLTKLFYPWARVVQKKAGKEAMEFMKEQLKIAGEA